MDELELDVSYDLFNGKDTVRNYLVYLHKNQDGNFDATFIRIEDGVTYSETSTYENIESNRKVFMTEILETFRYLSFMNHEEVIKQYRAFEKDEEDANAALGESGLSKTFALASALLTPYFISKYIYGDHKTLYGLLTTFGIISIIKGCKAVTKQKDQFNNLYKVREEKMGFFHEQRQRVFTKRER